MHSAQLKGEFAPDVVPTKGLRREQRLAATQRPRP